MPDERPVIPELVDREKADREQRETIRLARERAGLSQEELCRAVYKSKRLTISQSKLSLYEKGHDVSLSPKEIRAIETVLVKSLGRKERINTVADPGINALANALLNIESSPTVDKQLDRKLLLQRAGISQSAVAKELGIYRSKLNEWVNGKLELTSDEVAKLNEVVRAAEHRKNREDPYFLLESAYRILDEVWPKWQSAEERNKQQEELLELYRQYVADVENQNVLLREYLDSRQVASLANAAAEELGEKAHALPEIVKRPKLLS
jgi:transcriptional regulator with XRE-family HTH domain